MTKSTSIQQFIHTLDAHSSHQLDFSNVINEMHSWRHRFAKQIQDSLLKTTGFIPETALSKQIGDFNQQIIAHIDTWDAQWAELAPAQSLADAFENKVMFLIFGKFNAGKSSLCNLLADCFRLQGQAVQYFHLAEGHVVYTQDALREGATETTARLQGVCLGEKLVLLDTPGLHSVTAENAALTQRFIDSADGVLWLSSSSSPGQVQELDALGRELRRHKPLLPIITRSDQVEEDELDGEICTVLCNKNATQRALQEADVYSRSQDKLLQMQVEPDLLKTPVSISAQMARQTGFDTQSMTEAGFDHLFFALLALIEPAFDYKQRKSAEIFLHYLQEKVLEPAQQVLHQSLGDLSKLSQEMQTALAQQQEKIIANAWREIVPQVPTLLEEHASTQAINAVTKTLIQWAEKNLSEQLQQHLKAYQLDQISADKLTLDQNITYEIIAAGSGQAEIVRHDRLYNEISSKLQLLLTDLTTPVIAQCMDHLQYLNDSIQQLHDLSADFEHRLQQHAHRLRTHHQNQSCSMS
ncbi:dynamin family protein [Acinetobacter rudis]|uniref:Dynamin N-terminal domain-containing protein n=1 Tax=Acinetobacter rudis CIP 110305 TaxID=421052 RepID=S3N3V4_9GAMM|nr:dynamin family protein [Acinetobacter rudis]EPF74482.1 hypothetical protein F945_01521 [Acinetobacter rudis CIP 110305]